MLKVPAEELSRKLNPSSTAPFRQNPDFADRNILTEIRKKCSKLGPRAALFNLRDVRRRFELLNIYNQGLMLWKRYLSERLNTQYPSTDRQRGEIKGNTS